MRSIICCLFVLLWSLPLGAEIYKIRDENGRIIYTDQPPAANQAHEKVDLKPINRQAPVQVQPTLRPREQQRQRDEAVNYSVRLTSPADESHVLPAQRDVRVSAAVEPALKPNHRIQFLMDGQPLGEPSTDTSFLIEEIYRGEHKLSAQVLDTRGRILATSPEVTVYVHRPTVNSPGRR
jgi:hypothetical protein